MWRYCDLLALSEDFIPVFSEDVDKKHQGNWKFFIPHAQMRNLLEKLIAALERAHIGDNRSLWLTGAYGTGKTFAAFVVKHLLEDPLEAIEDYFQKHQILMPLWPRFKALRKNNRYLVIYCSASGHITSSRRLLIEVQQAIKEQLLAQGYKNAFSASLMEQLVNKLSDTVGIFNWEAAFTKYRGRFRTAATPKEVTERLRAGDIKLGEEVAAVLEEEGLTLNDSPAAVKAWIKEVIAANNLQGIVFIWDEFTEFFANNVPVTPLQELAQATADMPFYLFLITHRALNQFTRIDEDTRNKLRDRFHNCQLEMTPVTAYKLIANVIEPYADMRSEWEAKLDSLWSKVDRAVLHINLLGERVNKDDLKRMAPIHPFTAYLLANISSLYSSSQRTLFQFLKTEAPGSFQWFITQYPQDNWYWLTPDYLWQYFFEDVKIESLEAVSDLLSYYHSVRDSLSEEELRIFRVMLLLIALWRQTRGTSDLLKPTQSVLKQMFVGTDLHPRVGELADSLCVRRNIMLAIPTGNDCEYIIPTTTIDQTKLEECRRRVEIAFTFEKVIKIGRQEGGFVSDLKGLFSLQGVAKLRHPIEIVSARELKLRRDRVLPDVEKPYQIGVVLVVAQDDEDLIGSEDLAAAISVAHTNYCILISQIEFGARRWSEWLNYRAYSWYHQEMRDNNTQKYYDIKSSNIAAEWLEMVRTGRIRAFFQGRQEELNGCEVVAEYLGDIVASVFPYGPEKLSQTATLYDRAWGRGGAEIGLKVAQNIQEPYKSVVNELKAQGFWDGENISRHGDHPLAHMQKVVDSFFATHDHVNLKELWEALQQPPYGLMPSPIGILLFAFLLRGYAQGYYYSDGTNSLPLNPNKLAELIDQVMKGLRLSENYTIRKMSAQGERFCQMARDVFRLTPEQAAYPEEARKNMRKTIIELGYPLWAIVYYPHESSDSSLVEYMIRAVETLGEILSYERDELDDREMEMVVEAIIPIHRDLTRLLTRDRLQEGMKKFWEIHAPRLISLMVAVRLDVPQVISRLRTLLNEDVYLWREERVREKLSDVVCELDLVDALNTLYGAEKQDLDELRSYFRDSWFKGKLPLPCYKEAQAPEVADLIDYLYKLVYRPGDGIKENRAEDIRRMSGQLVSLLLGGGPSVAGMLVQKYRGHSLSHQEAAELYAALPDLSGATEDEVRQAVIQTLSQQARQKKIADLQQRWRELTGSVSPERWSEERGTPIQWVLEGQAHHDFFVRYSNVHQLSETDIDKMMGYLTEHAAELALLQDHQYVLDKFIQAAAGDYADLVRQAGMAGELQAHIRRVFKGGVYQWPMRLSEIQRLLRQWVTENYQVTAYPQVLKAIDSISPNEIKEFIKQLAAEEPLVGARVLSTSRRKIGRVSEGY